MIQALALVGRRGVMRRRLQTALAATGIGIGVAAAVGMYLANRAVLDSFRRTAEAVAGRATHQIIAGPSGLPDDLVPAIRGLVEMPIQSLHDVPPFEIGVAPAIEFHAPAEALGGEVVRVLGLDPLMDAEIRTWRWRSDIHVGSTIGEEARHPGAPHPKSRSAGGGSLEALLARADAIALTEPLARRLGAGVGDTIGLVVGGRAVVFDVVGLIDPGPAAAGGAGEFAVLDIAAAQEVLGEEGRLDRIDLVLPEPSEGGRLTDFLLYFQTDLRPYLEARIRSMMPADAELRTPRDLAGRREAMVRAFRMNLAALSFLALFVGGLIAAGAARFSVTIRRREIGVLRLLGATRRAILAAVLAEAAVLGALGGAAGVLLGRLLAVGITAMATRTVSDLYAFVRPDPPALDAATAVAGVLLGAVASVAAATAAARAAARIPPQAAIRRSEAEEAAGRRAPWRLAAAGASIAAGWALVRGPWAGPEPGFAAAFLVLAAAAALAPVATAAAAMAAPLLGAVLGPAGTIAGRNLGRAVDRTGAAVAALAVALAMTAGVTFMVRSFRGAVEDWLGQTLRADLYVSPAGREVAGVQIPLPPGAVEAIAAAFPDAEMNLVREADVVFRGVPVKVVAMRASVVGRRGGYPILDGPPAREAWARVAKGEALVSEPFARRFGARPGDIITLPTAVGEIGLRVAGVFADYSTDRGAIVIDLRAYRTLWNDPHVGGLSLFLPDGTRSAEALERLRSTVGRRYALVARDGRALRAAVLEVFDRTFAVVWALQAIAAAVAALGIAATFVAHVAARTREIGVLRATGMTRALVRRMVVAEAATAGAVGGVLAVGTGVGLAILLVRVINVRSFYWTIPLRLPPAEAASVLALAAAGAALAALWPAARAARLGVAEALREE